MSAVSTFCLYRVLLTAALSQLTAITEHIEIMDEGLHHLKNADILRNYSARYTIHAPRGGTNLASLLETIRQASVEVMAECFRIAGDVNGNVVLHPGNFAWEEERKRAEQQLVQSLLRIALSCSRVFG